MIRRLALLGAAAILATACGGWSVATEGLPTVEPESAVTSKPEATPGAGLVADEVSIKDAKGDLVDENDKKVKGNGLVDIVRLSASADGEDLRLRLDLAGTVPDAVSSTERELNYLFVIETDRSGEFDYWVMLDNLESGEWSPSLTDYHEPGGLTQAGARFPGVLMATGLSVMAVIPLAELGYPTTVRVSAITQLADHESGDVLAEDQVPKGTQMKPANNWVTLGK